ncbi:hypothetical protein K469DRAFT_796240 [Zopfia rhizophila CBS 207.26]|uniref:Uncharacterized protein n=1 Tax=Zopfia rhizophila CBS 207.26 TaxID=1314779 RepID=A0A6A6EPT7_9PEZI|nr:hypothetical protein K469DRAFT_796240 [Zopfia rhizophila CBS 207.26]
MASKALEPNYEAIPNVDQRPKAPMVDQRKETDKIHDIQRSSKRHHAIYSNHAHKFLCTRRMLRISDSCNPWIDLILYVLSGCVLSPGRTLDERADIASLKFEQLFEVDLDVGEKGPEKSTRQVTLIDLPLASQPNGEEELRGIVPSEATAKFWGTDERKLDERDVSNLNICALINDAQIDVRWTGKATGHLHIPDSNTSLVSKPLRDFDGSVCRLLGVPRNIYDEIIRSHELLSNRYDEDSVRAYWTLTRSEHSPQTKLGVQDTYLDIMCGLTANTDAPNSQVRIDYTADEDSSYVYLGNRLVTLAARLKKKDGMGGRLRLLSSGHTCTDFTPARLTVAIKVISIIVGILQVWRR